MDRSHFNNKQATNKLLSCRLLTKTVLCSKKGISLVIIGTLSAYVLISMIWPTSFPTVKGVSNFYQKKDIYQEPKRDGRDYSKQQGNPITLNDRSDGFNKETTLISSVGSKGSEPREQTLKHSVGSDISKQQEQTWKHSVGNEGSKHQKEPTLKSSVGNDSSKQQEPTLKHSVGNDSSKQQEQTLKHSVGNDSSKQQEQTLKHSVGSDSSKQQEQSLKHSVGSEGSKQQEQTLKHSVGSEGFKQQEQTLKHSVGSEGFKQQEQTLKHTVGGEGSKQQEQTLNHGFGIKGNNKIVQDDRNSSIYQDFEKRRLLYEKACGRRRYRHVYEVFIHPPSKLAVCHVQKVGCTFWKRIFRYLYRDYDNQKEFEDVNSPFDIDRVLVHFAKSTTYRTYRYETYQERMLADSMTKVMFTRDPYRRLWSSYVDKFVLPDSWLDHGRSILFRRSGTDPWSGCPTDIKFEEYLEYILSDSDYHWKPITEICDPCTFHPHYVGHMETFGRDVKYILDKHGLGYLMENHDHSTHVLDEMKLLIDYHFRLYSERLPLHACISKVQLAGLLWKVFQINGYFKMDAAFKEDRINDAIKYMGVIESKDTVTKIFQEEFLSNPNTKEEWEAQRETNIVNAYRSLPKTLKYKITIRFNSDFTTFGFDFRTPDERPPKGHAN